MCIRDRVGTRQRTAQHGGLLAGRERGVEVGAAHARVEERAEFARLLDALALRSREPAAASPYADGGRINR